MIDFLRVIKNKKLEEINELKNLAPRKRNKPVLDVKTFLGRKTLYNGDKKGIPFKGCNK